MDVRSLHRDHPPILYSQSQESKSVLRRSKSDISQDGGCS